jgi:hypothetical protein
MVARSAASTLAGALIERCARLADAAGMRDLVLSF